MATMKELDAKALANTLADKIPKIKAETLANTLGHVHSKAVFFTMAHRLAELHVKDSADTLCDVKGLAPVDFLAYMLAWKKVETHAATPEVDVEVNALLKTLADRLTVVKAKKFSDAQGHLQADSLVNKLAATQENMAAKTIGCTLRDVVGEALVDRTG